METSAYLLSLSIKTFLHEVHFIESMLMSRGHNKSLALAGASGLKRA